jgi:hypothetical protein
MWQSDIPPQPGMAVDVAFADDGTPERVFAVSESQLALQNAQKTLAGAMRGGELLTSNVKSRLRVPVIAAECLLLVAFFSLPCVLITPPWLTSAVPLTGWKATGFSPTAVQGPEYGLASLLSVVCLVAPLAAPFLKQKWAHWLNAVPLAFLLIGALMLWNEVHNIGRHTAGAIGDLLGSDAGKEAARQAAFAIRPGIGLWIAVACAVYLLMRALRKDRREA